MSTMDPMTVGQTNSILKCKACTAPVNSHKIVPPSPTPHLHRKIQMPDASEASILRKALRHANSDLHELHGDIAHIQAILDKLRLKRESLRKFTVEHDAFLAPIRRLPAEILIEIFMLCMSYDLSSFDPYHSPSLFGQVCRGWRQVALSTQKLWSSITVTYWPSSAKAKLWISRASSAPLTIRLDSVHPQTGRVGKIQPVIAVLVQHCDRWRHLDLRLDHSMLPCLNSIKHRLPWLESIRIEMPMGLHELDVFEAAPRLRSFFSGPYVVLTRLKLPWHQLTDLNAHIHTITECLNTLQLVPNLVTCTLYSQSSRSGASTPLQNIPILTFPHLRFFSILNIYPDEIFKHLQLPVIHTLRVEYRDKRKMSKDLKWFARQPFMSLLSSSSHTLRKLVIDHLDEPKDSAHIAHCLQATPSLEALCLRGPGHWVTNDFLRLLTRQADIKELVPNLEDLEIHDRYIPCDHSMSMIESRWQVGEDDNEAGARLKRLQFDMSAYIGKSKWLVDAEILNRLRKCRQEGMLISIFATFASKQDLLDIAYSSVT